MDQSEKDQVGLKAPAAPAEAEGMATTHREHGTQSEAEPETLRAQVLRAAQQRVEASQSVAAGPPADK